MFHQRRQHTTCFTKRFERPKKSCRVFLSPNQVQSHQSNGKRLKPGRKKWKSPKTFIKKKNNDMKSPYRDIKKIILMRLRLFHKRCNKRKAVAKTALKAPRSEYRLFLRKQLDEMTKEDPKNYWSIVSRRWKEIKEVPGRLSANNDRVRQMKNEVEELGDDL